jgi:uncharacterized protein (DUF1800 family)
MFIGSRNRILALSLGLGLAVATWTGCGSLSNSGSSSTPSTPNSGVSVSPATASVRAGATQQFSAVVSGTGTAGAQISQNVTWSVNGVTGGNTSVGQITSGGLYTAPATLPSPNPITVTAVSTANTSLNGKSSVTVENPMPTLSGVTPPAIPLGNFSVTLAGSGFVSTSQVTFGGVALNTTFVSATQLTATGTATAAQKGTMVNVAVVNPNPGSATSTAFAVKVGGTGIVAVSPATANVPVGSSQQFTAAVSGNSSSGGVLSPNVTWSVNGIVGGNAMLGTISTAGLYQAPVGLPSPNTLTVTATSVTDSTISGTSAMVVENPPPTLLNVSPSPVAVGSFTLTVLGTNFVSGSQVMFGGTPLQTTFIRANELQATGTASSAQNNTAVSVTVVTPNPGSATSNPYLIHVGTDNTSISITPYTGTLLPGQTLQFAATVTGITSQAVTWTVNSIPGGNASYGTISATGIYTAPKNDPTGGHATIGAIASDGTTAHAPAQITLLSGLPVVNSALPLDIPLGTFTISVNGSGFLSGAQIALNGTFLTTTFISANELSATGTANTAGTFPMDVTNPGAGSPNSNSIQVTVGSSTSAVTPSAAARLLEQSTFGPTPALIEHVQAVGMQGFLNEQFTTAASTYPTPGPNDSIEVVQSKFFTNALYGQDQLRQRVAFALSEMMVISNQQIGNTSAFTSYMNMLQKDSFGNFATLLNDVTLSPAMGNYLNMVNNAKTDPNSGDEPNENYAREVLQLFTIGLAELNPDGSVQVDGSGNPIPTYTQTTVDGFARALTGWTFPTQPGKTGQFWNPEYYGGPMIPFDNYHDTTAKLLLNGTTLPAGGTTQADLTAALQNIFQHPNVGPFISQQLIQHLVTSNPSPAYVSRVAAVFNDDGTGTRGNLQAVVTAILMDTEARRGDDPTQVQATDGHLKEPLLFMTSLLRAANATSDGLYLNWYAANMRQEPFESPSVFNFFPPNNPIGGTQLLGPEFRIFNSSTSITRVNYVNDLVWGQVAQNTTVDLSPYIGLAGNPGEMVDAMGSVLMHGQMPSDMRTTVLSTVTAISDNKERAQTAYYLIGSSSQFQVEH